MLSIASVSSGAAGYYTNKDNYYFLGNMESIWLGEGAKKLGLEGHVDEKVFSEALAGRLPGEISLERIVNNINVHRPGYDLTFSAPKSVSILAVIGGDKAMLDAHKHAVSIAASEVEKLVSTRVMEDGKNSIELTEKLVAAAFTHDTSRELDPQLHTHLIVLNATERDGNWRTLSSDTRNKAGFIETIYALQVALGKIYRHELRRSVESMGYSTIETGKNGLWEIDGVPVQEFSQRSQQIQAAVGDNASLKSRDVAALDTRKAKKQLPDKDELLTDWFDRLDKAGFDLGTFRQAAAQKITSGHTEPSGAAEPPDIRGAVNQMISQLSDRKTRFTYSEMMATTLGLIPVMQGTPAKVREQLDAAIHDQRLIPLDKEKGTFTSSMHLLDELSVQHLAGRMLAENKVLCFVSGTADETTKAELIAKASQPLLIIGSSGGAAAMRNNILDAVNLSRSQWRDVTVLATDSASERSLKEDTSLTQYVTNMKNLVAEQLPLNSTLIISHAEKLTLKQTVDILGYSIDRGVQVLFMDGAGRSGTGNALQTLVDSGVQRVVPTRKPKIETEINSISDKRHRYTALAEDYASLRSQGAAVFAQVSGPREQRVLTDEIRQVLLREGQLSEHTTTITSLVPQWLDSKTSRQIDTYREGMVLEQRDAKQQKTYRYVISRVGKEARSLLLVDSEGMQHSLKLSQIDSQWSLYRKEQIEIAEGESLTMLGRQGVIKSRDNVTVSKIEKDALIVEHNGKHQRLMTSDAIKATYGYVSAPGSRRAETGTVLAATAARDTNASMLNTLAQGGNKIKLYTPLSPEIADARLQKSLAYSSLQKQVNAKGEVLSDALKNARDGLMTTADKAVSQAISVTQGSEVIFSRLDILANALSMHPDLTQDKVEREIERQIKAGQMLPVPGAQGKARQQYVTASTWEMEKRIIRTILEGKDTLPPLMPNADATLFRGLTEGQQAASRLILDTTDRFIGIQGYAGVGKTTQLKFVLAALTSLPESQRPTVVGLAPTHRAVGEMSSVGINSQTVASFLMETENSLKSGEKLDFSKTLFIVDEGSMLGNRDMADTLNRIAMAGGRAVLSGDRDQLLSVDNGAPFSLMQERSALDTAIMKDIVRQTPALRPAIYNIIQRQLPEALNVICSVSPDVVERLPDREVPESSVVNVLPVKNERGEVVKTVIDAIVDDFTGRTAEMRDQTLIVVQTNADKKSINTLIHGQLQKQDELGKEASVTILDRVKTHNDKLKSVQGMAEHSGKLALINNSYFKIAVDNEGLNGGYVSLIDDEGRQHPFTAFESSLRDIAIFEKRTIEISVGDKISFTRSDKERGRETNSNWTVENISDGAIHIVQGHDKRVLKPDEDLADGHFDLGYAGTAHKAQGASALYVIVLAGVEGRRKFLAGFRDAYVALSRVKLHVQTYSDNLEKWMKSVVSSSDRQTAHDVLRIDDDRQAEIAAGVWERGASLGNSALGRALLREKEIDEVTARFISGSKKYPTPHIAWPAYDDNGRQRGILLSEIRISEEGRLEGMTDTGRMLGSDDAVNVLFQPSKNGETVIAASLQEAQNVAVAKPDTGIIIRTEGQPADWLVNSLSDGSAVDPDPLSLKTPEEQRLERALKEEAERLIEKGETASSGLEGTEDRAIVQISREMLEEEKLSHEIVTREAAKEQRIDQQELLRQTERELVKEKTLAD